MKVEIDLEILLDQFGLVHLVFDSCSNGKGKGFAFENVVLSSLNGFSYNKVLPAKTKTIRGNNNILYFAYTLIKVNSIK